MANHRQLFVLRHAKSSWDNPGLDDHERPLAPRGQRAVLVIGEHIRASGIAPDQVLCSSARRTRETLDAVSPPGDWIVESELYWANCTELIERLRRVPAPLRSVMIIGHNPALQMLVLRLTGANGNGNGGRDAAPPANRDLSDLQRKFPTGALATLDFDCEWNELAPGCARLSAFVRPRHL